MITMLKALAAFILSLTLVSCQESKTDSMTGNGTLRVIATDAPVDYDSIASAKITVSEISVRPANGEKITVSTKDMTLDLLQLRNGLVETLAEVSLPSGRYDEILLKISSASVDLKDGKHFDLTVPSGASSGLKVFVSPDIVINTNLSTDVLLDFDLSRSFVATGTADNITGFTFRPVIRASLLSFSGTISGEVISVTDETPIAGATVTIKKGTEIITTAVTDADGFFKILGLSAGAYNVTSEAINFGSLTIDAVPVTVGNEVTTHFILTPVGAL